MYSVKQVS